MLQYHFYTAGLAAYITLGVMDQTSDIGAAPLLQEAGRVSANRDA